MFLLKPVDRSNLWKVLDQTRKLFASKKAVRYRKFSVTPRIASAALGSSYLRQLKEFRARFIRLTAVPFLSVRAIMSLTVER